jgi:hypothetical protein
MSDANLHSPETVRSPRETIHPSQEAGVNNNVLSIRLVVASVRRNVHLPPGRPTIGTEVSPMRGHSLARFGPTTPTRARRPFDASVDPTEARNAPGQRG